jgi:hypothetical protein
MTRYEALRLWRAVADAVGMKLAQHRRTAWNERVKNGYCVRLDRRRSISAR